MTKRSALVLAAMLLSTAAHAENIIIGCPVVYKFSEFEVNTLLSEARSVLPEHEVGGIYARYLALKSACRTNPAATRSVAVSGGLRSLLAQHGVDVSQLRTALR